MLYLTRGEIITFWADALYFGSGIQNRKEFTEDHGGGSRDKSGPG